MELHQLRYLRSIVRSGSVTAAAVREHVTQPSISKQIHVLEQELGVPLFHRVGRRVLPTDAALQLVDCADRVLDDLAATAAALAGPQSSVGGSVRICATETLVNFLLPRPLVQLRRDLPGAAIHVEMLGTAEVVASVAADEVDFGLAPLPLTDSRLEVQPLLTEEVLAVVPRTHAWARRPWVQLARFLEEPGLLLSMPGMGLRAQVEAAARPLGASVASTAEVRSEAALLAMVAAGGGVTLAPRMSVLGRRDVRALPLRPRVQREIVWLRRRGRHISAAGRHLLGLLAQ
jgi:LysR family transcriptional regulator, cyn operon transcriptional activator